MTGFTNEDNSIRASQPFTPDHLHFYNSVGELREAEKLLGRRPCASNYKRVATQQRVVDKLLQEHFEKRNEHVLQS